MDIPAPHSARTLCFKKQSPHWSPSSFSQVLFSRQVMPLCALWKLTQHWAHHMVETTTTKLSMALRWRGTPVRRVDSLTSYHVAEVGTAMTISYACPLHSREGQGGQARIRNQLKWPYKDCSIPCNFLISVYSQNSCGIMFTSYKGVIISSKQISDLKVVYRPFK